MATFTLQEFLSKTKATGCQAPGCIHSDHELVLNARCHPGARMRVSVVESVLRIACAECNTVVVQLGENDGAHSN